MSEYGTKLLLNGGGVGFMSSAHPHYLEYKKDEEEIVVSTNYAELILPPCVWHQIGEFWVAKQAEGGVDEDTE